MASILIIDDNDQMRWLVRTSLEGTGHEIIEASDGGEGLQVYARRPTDLVICDIYMPGMEGLETIRRLRQQHPQVKIISMSGGRSLIPLDVLNIAGQLGAVRALQKPFSIGTLVSLVTEVLTEELPNGPRSPS